MEQQGFPYEEKPLDIDVGSFTATLTYPLIMSWLLPVYVYNIVLEKEEKLREMMRMVIYPFPFHLGSQFSMSAHTHLILQMGLKMTSYWFITVLYDFMLYLAVLIVVYGMSYAFSFAIFTQGR